MEAWLSEDQEGLCKPCVLPVALAWYSEALEEQGQGPMADSLKALANDPSIQPLQLAQELDRIKATVPSDLAQYLKELDCTVQVNAEELEGEG
jgi:hypothetical protein